MVSVTVCTAGPECMQCRMTLRVLEAAGIPVTVVDLGDEANASVLHHVTTELGYSQAPIVLVNDHPELHWSGFQVDLLKRLSTEAEPQTRAGAEDG